MAEEKKLCIQDRLRSAVMRLKEIFVSWPIICLILIFLLFIVALPEILTHFLGRETLIPLLSVLSLEGRFEVLFGLSVAVVTAMQYKVSRSLLRIEQHRNPPIIVAKIYPRSPLIFVENKGGGMAWSLDIHGSRLDTLGTFDEFITKIYPYSGDQVIIPEEWHTQTFDLFIGITYYTKEDKSPDSFREWAIIFRNIGVRARDSV